MKNKIFLLVGFLLVLTVSSCKDDGNKPEPQQLTTLEGTKWKLVGFYDVKADTLAAVTTCEDCFAFTFFTDSMLNELGLLNYRSSVYLNGMDSAFYRDTPLAEFPLCELGGNVLWAHSWGFYKIDYSTLKMKIAAFEWDPRIGFGGEADSYVRAMNKVQSFSFSNEELKLYYNDQENYLLFKRYYLPFFRYGGITGEIIL